MVLKTHIEILLFVNIECFKLLWLTTNNPYFKDVEIDREAINCLPENGIPNGLRFVLATKVSPHEDEDEGPPQEHAVDNDVVEESVLGGERTSFWGELKFFGVN